MTSEKVECDTINSMAIFLMQKKIDQIAEIVAQNSYFHCLMIICNFHYSNGSSRYLWAWYLCNVLKYSLFSSVVAATLLCVGFSLLYLMAWSSPVTAVRHDVSRQDLWYINTWFKWRNWLGWCTLFYLTSWITVQKIRTYLHINRILVDSCKKFCYSLYQMESLIDFQFANIHKT